MDFHGGPVTMKSIRYEERNAEIAYRRRAGCLSHDKLEQFATN